MKHISRRLAGLAAGATAAALLGAAPASAGTLAATADCSAKALEQPFLPWGDPASYVLAPDGGMEGLAQGWTLSNGAAVVDGNEAYFAHGAADTRSLALPAGSSATSQAMCVGLGYPTIRAFTRASSTTWLSALRVEALFEDPSGAVHSQTIGYVLPTGAWQPTPVMALLANFLAPLYPDGQVPMAYRFTPLGPGSWQLDDLYVDPWRSP